MAAVVQSSATTDWGNASSVVITKPTGLSVGDLMIACIAVEGQTSTTPSGWTAIDNNDSDMTAAVYGKIADSSDVAASNFTFSVGGTAYCGGVLLRIDGIASGLWNDGNGGDVANGNQTPDLSFTGFTPTDNGELLVGFMVMGQCDPVNDAMVTGYTINGTNPSWTAVDQDSITTNNPTSGDGVSFAVAYATQTTAAEISDFDVTLSGSYGTPGDWASVIVAIRPQVDVTGTFSHLSVSPSFTAPAASVGVTATHSHLAVAATTNALSGTASAPTQWTNEAEGSTTWTNESSL